MGLYDDLRSMVFLRRISRELKRMNDLAETRLRLDHPDLGAKRIPRLTTVAFPTIDDWNKRHARDHPDLDDAS